MKTYLFGCLPHRLYCGGGSAPTPPPPPPNPQIAKVPDAMAVRKDTMNSNVAQGGGKFRSTLLTGGQGDEIDQNKLGKSTLLGRLK
jgi:hypothetical protein